ATDGLYDTYGEDRVIDSPLAESGLVGVSIGAAMYGLRPIAEIQFVDFILPAVNQIVSEAAKIRYRSNNDWDCPITIRADRKSTRLNSSHDSISYAVFCFKK